MTTKNLINQIKLESPQGLAQAYEGVCEEYRKRLCDQWEIPFDESWWNGGAIGEELFLADWWMPLNMEQIRYVVDNCVFEDEWLEYCDFVESEIHDGRQYPRINFRSWFMGVRPKDLKDDLNPQDKESVEA